MNVHPTFGRDDIPLVRLLLDEAHTWIFQQAGDIPCTYRAFGNTNRHKSLEDNGVEPMTSCMPFRGHRVPGGNLSGLTATADSRCTTCCTSKPEKARRSRSKAVADAAPAAAVESSEGDFAKALLMIASLPLSDAEKADAVRRLMADQAAGPVCGP